jgi:hypothetical protein
MEIYITVIILIVVSCIMPRIEIIGFGRIYVPRNYIMGA